LLQFPVTSIDGDKPAPVAQANNYNATPIFSTAMKIFNLQEWLERRKQDKL
jgi:hypothetical protein